MGDEDTASLPVMTGEIGVKAQTVVADKGYHSNQTMTDAWARGLRSCINEPHRKWKWHRRYSIIPCAVVVVFVMGTLFSSASHAQDVHEVEAKLVDFDELFVLEDTVRLDPSVIIGDVSDMDINAAGDMLITDEVARTFYRFSATGKLMYELSAEECHPAAEFGISIGARFTGDGRIIVWNSSSGDGYIFDGESGVCTDYVKSEKLVNVSAVCVHNDSVFAQPLAFHGEVDMRVLSSTDLTFLGNTPIKPTQWPKLTSVLQSKSGRSMECFDDGAWYTYVYSADATPVKHLGKVTHYKPPFFNKRTRDKLTTDFDDRRGLFGPSEILGLYRLNSSTRLVVHFFLRYRGARLRGAGLTIVDHKNRFAAVSTVSSLREKMDLIFTGAGNGVLYFKGDHEPLADGDVGNPLLLRYRFIPPHQ